jgi:hypothetical protein
MHKVRTGADEMHAAAYAGRWVDHPVLRGAFRRRVETTLSGLRALPLTRSPEAVASVVGLLARCAHGAFDGVRAHERVAQRFDLRALEAGAGTGAGLVREREPLRPALECRRRDPEQRCGLAAGEVLDVLLASIGCRVAAHRRHRKGAVVLLPRRNMNKNGWNLHET